MADNFTDYKVADINLADWGRKIPLPKPKCRA